MRRKLAKSAEERDQRAVSRMDRGTGLGRYESASPVRSRASRAAASSALRASPDCVGEEFTWFEGGTLGTWESLDRWYPPFEIKLFSVHIAVGGDAPTGSSIIVNIKKNGTSIFTSDAHKPHIAASAVAGFTALIDNANAEIGDYYTFEIEQVGSTVPGSDLAVTMGFLVCPGAASPTPGISGPCALPDLPGSVSFETSFASGDTSDFDVGTGGTVGNVETDPTTFAGITPPCSTYAYTGVNQFGEGFSGAFSLPGGTTEVYFRSRVYIRSTTNGLLIPGGGFVYFGYSGSDVDDVSLDSSGKLRAIRHESGTNLLATGGSVFPYEGWHLIQIHLKMHTSAGVFDVSVDDAASPYGFTFSGRTAASGWTIEYIQLTNPQTAQCYYFADIQVSTVP